MEGLQEQSKGPMGKFWVVKPMVKNIHKKYSI
jgi:hypothetical protein